MTPRVDSRSCAKARSALRYDVRTELTAGEIVNRWPLRGIGAHLPSIRRRRARRLPRRFSTHERKRHANNHGLRKSSRSVGRRGKTHPATRVLQSTRIAVNDEAGELQRGLAAAESLLKPGGKIVVLSFHSLEDRIVKQFLKDSPSLEVLSKHALRPSKEEIARNPRARSTKMRIAKKR